MSSPFVILLALSFLLTTFASRNAVNKLAHLSFWHMDFFASSVSKCIVTFASLCLCPSSTILCLTVSIVAYGIVAYGW